MVYPIGVDSGVLLMYEAGKIIGYQSGWKVQAGYSATDGRPNGLSTGPKFPTQYSMRFSGNGHRCWMGDGGRYRSPRQP